ncbi:hypothetical protein, partial [Burkholderia stabilis]|uniref:hypothetical protein n=1 Tax=Burkholderia stabilis TaxID=95485 RepID=UPI001F4B4765
YLATNQGVVGSNPASRATLKGLSSGKALFSFLRPPALHPLIDMLAPDWLRKDAGKAAIPLPQHK